MQGKLPTAYRLLPFAYLYGSLPLVYLLGRQRRVDLKTVGSGNVGSSNLWATGGAVRGVSGWLFDASKGLLPIVAGRRLGCSEEIARLAGVCGVAGQCWPVFLRFDGGRGISAFVGAAFALGRRGWLAAILPMIGGGLWRVAPLLARRHAPVGDDLRATRSRAMPLGCFVSALAVPLACNVRRPPGQPFSVAPLLLSAVILLRRLTAPLPDDAEHGPAVQRRALLYRLVYDRNTRW